jgi:hypothetical protein
MGKTIPFWLRGLGQDYNNLLPKTIAAGKSSLLLDTGAF